MLAVSCGAIRFRDWKLTDNFATGEDELFSLPDDPGESSNLAAEKPDIVVDLKKRLHAWQDSVGVNSPPPPSTP